MNRINSKSVMILCILSSSTQAALPLYPAQVIARDLRIPVMGWLGHIGITIAPSLNENAYQVIEVLQANPVIQVNTVSGFKTIATYWGSRFGIADRGSHALKLLRTANLQKDLGCTTYTMTSDYSPNVGYYDGQKNAHATQCGFFRCDTFVNYVFKSGGYRLPTYNPPGKTKVLTMPKLVFSAFPNGNGDGPRALESFIAPYKSADSTQTLPSINSITATQLAALTSDDFVSVVDVSAEKITGNGINHLFLLAQNSLLSSEQRVFIIDKMGFVGTPDTLADLIKWYDKLDDHEDASIKSQIIASTQNLYQRHVVNGKHPEEKAKLQAFYEKMMEKRLSATDKAIVIRGFISLGSHQFILSKSDFVQEKIQEQDNRIDSETALKLKMELFNKSPELQGLLVSDIITMLKQENKTDLEGVFHAFIVDELSHLGPNALDHATKETIIRYLDSVKFKYDNSQNKLARTVDANLFSYGAWLEASALVNSNSFEEAGNYLADYIAKKNPAEQMDYIIGFSNSDYMKKAFETVPVFMEFRKNNQDIYLDTVGLLN